MVKQFLFFFVEPTHVAGTLDLVITVRRILWSLTCVKLRFHLWSEITLSSILSCAWRKRLKQQV